MSFHSELKFDLDQKIQHFESFVKHKKVDLDLLKCFLLLKLTSISYYSPTRIIATLSWYYKKRNVEIKKALVANDFECLSLVKKLCRVFISLLEKAIDPNLVLGKSYKKTTKEYDHNGNQIVVQEESKLPSWIENLLFNVESGSHAYSNLEAIEQLDNLFFQEFYGEKVARKIVPQSIIDEIYKSFDDTKPENIEEGQEFLSQKEIADNFINLITSEKSEHLIEQLIQGGYQSGKTRIQRWCFAIFLNMFCNTSDKSLKDIAILASSINSVHRNFVQKFCGEYGLKQVSDRANTWYPAPDIKVNIFTHRNLSHDHIVGSSFCCVMIDEQNLAHKKTFIQTMGRLTTYFKNEKGATKTLVFMTRNPDFNSEVCKIAESRTAVSYGILSADSNPVRTLEQKIEFARMYPDEENSNDFKIWWHGLTLPQTRRNSIFNMKENMFDSIESSIEEFYKNRDKWKPRYRAICIGYDHGYYSMAGWICTGFYQSGKVEKCEVIAECLYEKGHGRDDEINKKKDEDLVNLITEMLKYSTRVSLVMPHDATYYINQCRNLIEDKFIDVVRIYHHTEKTVSVANVIDGLRIAFSKGLIKIDGSRCKVLKEQLYNYQYKIEKLDGESMNGQASDQKEVILKKDDHAVDAFRYSCQYFLYELLKDNKLKFKSFQL